MKHAVFHLDAGGCGACGAELRSVVEQANEFRWATTPAQADLVVVTGAVMPALQAALLHTLKDHCTDRPLVVVGRCAIEGSPFGKGAFGGRGAARLDPSLTVIRAVDGCPPAPSAILAALLEARPQRRRP